MSKKSQNKPTVPVGLADGAAPILNTRARKAIARQNRKKAKNGSVAANDAPTDARQISSNVHVYTDDSYKDKRKKVFTSGMKAAKERIAAINAKFQLPEKINTACRPLSRLLRWHRNYTRVLIINRDGKERAFLPDKPGDHRILCHGSIAHCLISKVCMLVRITANEDKDGKPIDGSWAIVPAQYAMMRATTIQHLKRRPFFFLHRYWYEISFDGRVQPAYLLLDYGLNPEAKKTQLYVTHEYIPVREQDETNDYFRFWHSKPK